MIRFRCKCCHYQIERPDTDAGTTVACPECREICPVPDGERERSYGREVDVRDEPPRRRGRDSLGREEEIYRDEPPRRRGRDRDDVDHDRPRRGGRFRCPFCGTTEMPIVSRRISTGGWITFGVLMFVCFPLFWIGLLMKEDYSICYDCRAPLS